MFITCIYTSSVSVACILLFHYPPSTHQYPHAMCNCYEYDSICLLQCVIIVCIYFIRFFLLYKHEEFHDVPCIYIYTTRIYPSASLRHTAGEWEASPRAPSPATTLSQPKHDDDDNQKRTSNMNQPKWLTSHHSEPREIDLHCIVEHQEYV